MIPLTRRQRLIVEGAVIGGTVVPIAGPWAITIESARLAARLLGATVGIGVGGEGSAVAGLFGTVGLYFTPDGDIGGYGSLGGGLGFLYGLSLTGQCAITRGGIENFSGFWQVYTISGGEGLVGGACLITSEDNHFLGVGGQFGIGAGVPVEAYWQISNTYTSEPIVNAPLP